MKTYFAPIDVLRFLAAFWVMNYHYFLEYNDTLYWHRYGNLGVQIFFIISGFVIVQSLKGKSLKDFAIGRFIRLFPVFWILCTITYIITLLVPNSNPVHFREYLLSMTMLGDQFDFIIGYTRLVDPAYWTLAVELIFYTAIALFVSFFSYRRLRYFFLAWFIISIAAFMIHKDETIIFKFMLVRHTSYFIFGGALALIITKEARNLYEQYFDKALLVLSASYATYIHTRSIPAYTAPNTLDGFIITVLHLVFFISIPILVYLSPRITNKKTLAFCTVLGGLTYPLYLMHETIGNIFIKYLNRTLGFDGTLSACFVGACIIGIAYVVYIYDKKLRATLQNTLTAKQ